MLEVREGRSAQREVVHRRDMPCDEIHDEIRSISTKASNVGPFRIERLPSARHVRPGRRTTSPLVETVHTSSSSRRWLIRVRAVPTAGEGSPRAKGVSIAGWAGSRNTSFALASPSNRSRSPPISI